MKYPSILFAALLGTLSAVMAQESFLRLEADAALFRYGTTGQVWEWYYAFPDTALTYVPRDGRYVGEMYCRISIRDTAQTVVARQEWIVANTIERTVDTVKRNLIGVKRFALDPGTYTVECTVADMARRSDSLFRSFQIVIARPTADRLDLSDVQLATSIGSADDVANPAYVKGTVGVVPNPELLYIVPEAELDAGVLLPYYFEVYNAQTLSPEGVNIDYTVFDAARRPVVHYSKKQTVPADAFPVYGQLPLDTLASGVYYFAVKMTTTGESADSAVAIKKFYVLNPAKPAEFTVYSEAQDYEISEFAIMGSEQVQEEFEMIAPLLIPQDRDKFALLTEVTAQRRFLYAYWKGRDPDPETPHNKARQDFKDLIQYADTYFTTLQKKGWRTDRGRVLRQYGKPDRVDISPYSTEAKPYAIWSYYYVQGGVQFCFVEMNGMEDYTLVHSTAKNEIMEARWYERYAEIMGAAQFHR